MIAVLAPYGRNEVTAAALRLADWCLAAGAGVRVGALHPGERGVHPFWDRFARAKFEGVARAAAGASAVVWFGHHPGAHTPVGLACRPSARHVLVHLRGQPAADAAALGRYALTVFPTRAGLDAYTPPAGGQAAWVRWDAGLAPVGRRGPVAACGPRIALYLDRTVIDRCPEEAVALADGLLAAVPDAALDVVSAKAWPRRHRRGLAAVARSTARCVARRQGDLVAEGAALLGYDWALFPALEADFGVLAARAAASGCRVLAHDVPPFSEALEVGPDYGLVAVPAAADRWGVPAALGLNPAAWVEAVARAADRRDGYWRRPVGGAGAKAFGAFWGKALDDAFRGP